MNEAEIRLRCLELAQSFVSPSVEDRVGEVVKAAHDLYNRGIMCDKTINSEDTPRRGKRKGPKRTGQAVDGPSPNEDTPGNVTA